MVLKPGLLMKPWKCRPSSRLRGCRQGSQMVPAEQPIEMPVEQPADVHESWQSTSGASGSAPPAHGGWARAALEALKREDAILWSRGGTSEEPWGMNPA